MIGNFVMVSLGDRKAKLPPKIAPRKQNTKKAKRRHRSRAISTMGYPMLLWEICACLSLPLV
jgi:type II secretory pathway component PulF